jgi:hypothetical protein
MRSSPFDLWRAMWSSAFALAESGFIVSEMMRASAEVVHIRSRSILAATRDPLNADYAELGLMVTEKVEGFSEAGLLAMEDVRRLQVDVIGQWQQILGLASGVRRPSQREAGSFLDRQTRMVERAGHASGKMMTPLHSRVTANAKRLGQRD